MITLLRTLIIAIAVFVIGIVLWFLMLGVVAVWAIFRPV